MLRHLTTLPDYPQLTLQQLAVKLTMLILLSTMCHKCVLPTLSLQQFDWSVDNVFNFKLTKLNEPSNIRNLRAHHGFLELFPYPEDPRLCPVTCLTINMLCSSFLLLHSHQQDLRLLLDG